MPGLPERVVRRNEIPGRSTIRATSWAAWLGSLGYRTVLPHTARIMARSSRPICDGPSSPMLTPACEPQRWIVALLTDAMRIKSKARVKKAAKVEQNGRLPNTARPTAAPTICCSAINISK